MELGKIIEGIEAERPEITSVIFVGCGASQAGLYPVKYFLEGSAKKLRTSLYTANEFVHATPACVGRESITITCSLDGSTPETVEAFKRVMNMNAKAIAITHTSGSPLANSAHYVVLHEFEKSYTARLEKMTFCLQLAAGVLNQYEGYEHYQDMITSFGKIFDLIEDAISFVVPSTEKFAENYKDAPVIYIISSGATHMVAYSFSICLLMEIRRINSGPFHNSGFFHGPFEIVDKDVPFLLLIDSGSTRASGSRVLDFLNRSRAKAILVDAKDFGLGSVIPTTVKDYFNPMLITTVLRVYAEQLVILRNCPLTQRGYMWKLEY